MTEQTASSSPEWDAIVIGGGPAGSTAAMTLARRGRRVLVLEKEKFPRFHIGESLLPYNRRVFDELGLSQKIDAAGFMQKRGAQFMLGSGEHRVRLNFSNGSFNEFKEAIHVERSVFDKLLLDHARECGAEVREECLVRSHVIDDDGVAVRHVDRDGVQHEVRARFLIDASGLANFTANRESRRRFYQGHRKVAIFSHFDEVDMPGGEERGDIVIVRCENAWFWMIPLSDEKTSVGYVLDGAEFQRLGKDASRVFDEAVASTTAVRARMSASRCLHPLAVAADFSYRNDALVGPRIVRVGDASGFIDPIFSSGVMLAMTSGVDGALAVDGALGSGRAINVGMRRYERRTRRRIGCYWEFIENFYERNFMRLFLQPQPRFRMVCSVSAVLAGRTELPFPAWWRLRMFFLLVGLNRWLPIAKPLELR